VTVRGVTHGDIRVIIVGGGIAGIAAAVTLAQRGVRVDLIETRKKLGGRATSFTDARTGEELDNCQHVALGCCTNFVALCAMLGVRDAIEWFDRLWWIERGGRETELRADAWAPAPLHLARSFAHAAFLSASERAEIAGGIAAALRADREAWTSSPFTQWLDETGQSVGAVRKFWAPVMVSACNAGVDRIAASVGLHVLQEGLLAHRDAFRVGVPRVPLRRLYDGAQSIIEAAGGRVRFGAGAQAVSAGHVTLRSGERVDGDFVVLAAPVERAAALLERGGAMDARVGMLGAFTPSPIVGVHVRFDRPVLHRPHAVLVDAETQWLFRKDEAGAAMHAVISGADEWLGLSEAEATERVLRDVHAALGERAGSARLLWSRVVKERRATWAPTPLAEAHRPKATGRSGVILAGCYTDTGWPSTMEGAARSGFAAAAAVLGADAGEFLVPSLRPEFIGRVLGGRSLRSQHGVATRRAADTTTTPA
jgi:zeta-carotene desaturase